MRIQNTYTSQYRNMYNTATDLINIKEEENEEKVNKKESKKNNYNSNVVGQGTQKESNEEESNKDEDKITSKIVVNPNGMRTLLMLRDSKVFSSLNLGESDNMIEEPSKDEISGKDISTMETINVG